jgi:acetylornithine deacetylase
LADDRNQELGQRLAATVGEVRSRCQCVGVAYGTDAAQIASFGIPSVVFGPGSIEQAHTADEWLSLAELEAASEILYRFARNYG